jgi:predicted lipid-binding transport protein (Tim44 family)
MSGPLGSTIGGIVGGVKSGAQLGGLAAGLLGGTAAAGIFGGLGQIAGMLGMASALASFFGVNPSFNAELGMPNEADFQSVRDIQGAYAEAAARQEASQAMADRMNARQNEFDTMQASGGWGSSPDAASTGETDTSNDGEAGRGGGID